MPHLPATATAKERVVLAPHGGVATSDMKMRQAAFMCMACAWLRTDMQGAAERKKHRVQQLLGLSAHAGSQGGLRLGVSARRIQLGALLRLQTRKTDISGSLALQGVLQLHISMPE